MHRQAKVWVVDDDSSIRWVLERALNQAGIDNESFADADQLLQRMSTEQPDVIISDIRMPGTDGLELLSLINDKLSGTAGHHHHRPLGPGQRGHLLPARRLRVPAQALRPGRGDSRSPSGPWPRPGKSAVTLPDAEELPQTEIIGEAPAMQEVFRAIGRLAHSNITVLINGESGTGKELVARALHRHSPRAQNPFIALNMAAIPRDLMESELFGHEKGAFTGANSRRTGRFEQADGGTLFLDEIGDMPAETQTRLLRVLADGEFYRVGGHVPVNVDVRIIAATHQDLEALVQQGDFREDLFHRLNVIRIHIPKLAERREDIPRLMQYFLQRAAEELGGDTKILLPETEEFLSSLDWPGNVRQLENTCRWITVMASGREIHLQRPAAGTGQEHPHRQPQPAQSDWREMLSQLGPQRIAAGQAADTAGGRCPPSSR